MAEAYGLIGFPVEHSFSPKFFREMFDRESIPASYTAFQLKQIADFPDLISSHPNLRGLNVTIPYKEEIIPYLNALDPQAESIGAVNCVKINNGKLKGYNTDVTGFINSLQPLLRPHHTQALVLGSGGAAKAVWFALKQLGVSYTVVSRSSEHDLNYRQIDEAILQQCHLIINTTPLGMYPNIEECPDLPYQYLGPDHLLFDLVYNPSETQFLKNGRMQGAQVQNGWDMLRLQALAAWEIWQSPML